MRVMITTITDSAVEAATVIKRGGIIAFPTETVYGLGADVFNEAAVAKIFDAKHRPADNPLIVHIAAKDQIDTLAANLTDSARSFVEAFFPGPLTLVLHKSTRVPLIATAGLDTVGVRMPRHSMAAAFLAECGTPVAAPSANISGRPSPTTWQAVLEDLDGRIDCILRGGAAEVGLESTVVDCTGEIPVVLRTGGISIEELRQVCPDTIELNKNTELSARSPGTRHQHYAPAAKVILVEGDTPIQDGAAGYIGLSDRSEKFALKRVYSTKEVYARNLFEFFRECDRTGINTIYCEVVDRTGLGAALMDRLERASAI
jgi:L-threonylcarbamoyladenylate synthase